MLKRLFLSVLPILFLCALSSFISSANASTVIWTGGGANNLASNSDNWSGSSIPQNGDDVVYDATSSKNCSWDFEVALVSLSINSGYTGTVTIASTLTITDTVTWTGGGTDNLASNPANWSGGVVPQDGDEVIFNDSSPNDCEWDLNITPDLFSLSSTYTGTITLNTNLAINSDLNVGGGILNLNDKSLNVNGDIVIGLNGTVNATSSAITLLGNWTNNGNFNADTSTLTLNGSNQTIYGSTTFYNLVKSVSSADTLYFEAGNTQTIANNLTLNGVNGELLSLRSTSSGSYWYIDPQGTNNVSFVNVKDSNNTNLKNIVAPDSVNTGNNINWSFVGDPPVAITDPATNVNGNSATLNATVNPVGADTTVYFEWDTDTSYNNSTSSEIIGSGTDYVSVEADLTGLSINTTYYYRIVASSSNGTNYGSDESFTTPPIILTITSPLDADTINRPDVMVKGAVTNATGNETGVTVNGIVAVVHNGEFFVNHVPLEEGQNTITVNATDTEGNTATTSITVTAVTTLPYVTVRANIESGISPFETYFSVSKSIPNSVTSYDFDYEGDSVVDYTGTTFEDISVIYSAEGVYYPTVTATDNQSNTYTDTIAIVVLNVTDLDALLQAKWNAMKTALGNQDINTALNYFAENSKELYNEFFTALSDLLPQIVQDMQSIQLIYSENNMAKYRIRRNELYGGQMLEITYYIYFAVDSDGMWKIRSY